jgi:hypothetical protein
MQVRIVGSELAGTIPLFQVVADATRARESRSILFYGFRKARMIGGSGTYLVPFSLKY